jgi:hypothetical protein
MRFQQILAGVIGLCVLSLSSSLQAELMIEETFTDYLDNALISADPAGQAFGLTGNWSLVPDSNFYVNKTQADFDAGTGKAVYDRPSGDNGTRTATRNTSTDHVLYENDGDLFYASFLIDPARVSGDMTFELNLRRIDGGGVSDFIFGISGGQYFVGNDGINLSVGGGTVTAAEQLVVVRIEYGAADNGPDADEVVTLWTDPVDESSTPVIDGDLTDILTRGGGKITSVSMRGDQMFGAPAFYDNLRVGSSFTAVTALPADFDEDGDVDGADFLKWQRGESFDPLSQSDLYEWVKYFGTMSVSNPIELTAIPEPATGILLVLGMTAMFSVRRTAVSIRAGLRKCC